MSLKSATRSVLKRRDLLNSTLDVGLIIFTEKRYITETYFIIK